VRGRFFPTWGIFALTACGGEAAENARATAWDAEIAVDAALGTDGATGVPDAAPDPDAMPPAPASVGVTGNAFNFASQGGSLIGGVVSVLERPGVTATTTDDGAFAFDVLPVGAELTFVLSYMDYPPIQTGTHVLPPDGMARVSFQAPDPDLYDTLARVVRVIPAPDRCQIATTVTRVGNSLYDDTPGTHGEPDATVTIDPTPPDVDGPVYFNLVKYNVIWPDRQLRATTADGGVLFLNVPEGEYTLRASKPDTTFRPVKIKCRAGFLANASPPWGLQALTGGVGPRTEPDWQ
jgi:hypothetical protein